MGLNVRIITPKGLYAQLDVDSLTIKLTSGYRTILKGHTPLIGALAISSMHVVIDGKENYYAVHGGAINVTNKGVTLIVNEIESKEEIDIERAKAARDRANERLNSNDSNIDIKRARIALQRALARLEAASKN